MRNLKEINNIDSDKVKSHIRRIFPRADRIDIKVNQLPNGEYKSLVRVKAPKRKELIARKKDKDIKRSLEKSHLAIIRQIHRLKTRFDPMNASLPEALPAF